MDNNFPDKICVIGIRRKVSGLILKNVIKRNPITLVPCTGTSISDRLSDRSGKLHKEKKLR